MRDFRVRRQIRSTATHRGARVRGILTLECLYGCRGNTQSHWTHSQTRCAHMKSELEILKNLSDDVTSQNRLRGRAGTLGKSAQGRDENRIASPSHLLTDVGNVYLGRRRFR